MAGEFILSVADDSTTAPAPLRARLRRARRADPLHAHQVKPRYGGADRVSTKANRAEELRILGEALVRARQRAKLKQSDVAARLGLPSSYLSKIESGTRRLDVVELIRVAEAMGVDPAEIVREVAAAMRADRGRT